MRNKIINGSMAIDQRGTATTPISVNAASLFYSTDRWFGYGAASAGVFTLSQSTTAPSGFSNSLKATCTTADSSVIGASRYFIDQRIEGFSVCDLKWGTADAKPITISFYVYSSLVGAYCLSILNSDASRSYISQYSIEQANTWEKKTITIPGCTDGVWLKDSGIGLSCRFALAIGSNYRAAADIWSNGNYNATAYQANWMSSSAGRNFYISGVQLEVGSIASSFEHRPNQVEISLCQRYYARLTSFGAAYAGFGSGICQSTTVTTLYLPFPQKMRASPTISQSNTCVTTNVTTTRFATTGFAGYYSADNSAVVYTTHTGLTGQAAVVWCGNNNANAYVDLNAEL
jgi:hypothetical protein